MTPIDPTCHEGADTANCFTGSNGIHARLVDNILWVTQVAGGADQNFCLDPTTNRTLAQIPDSDIDNVVGISPQHVYLTNATTPTETVTAEPVPKACENHSS